MSATTTTDYYFDFMRRKSLHNVTPPVGNSRAVRRLPPKPRSLSSVPIRQTPPSVRSLASTKSEPGRPRNPPEKSGASIREVLEALREQDYFHGILPREQINDIIQKDGDFIVRESKKEKSSAIVLSVFWGQPRHFLLNRCTDGKWALNGPSFKNVTDLVTHYLKTKEELSKVTGARLLHPVKKERWHLSHDDIEKESILGKGHFGEVWKGTIKGTFRTREVAIKLFPGRQTTPEEKSKILEEAQIMMGFNHPNVVKFIGVVTDRDPLMLIMELVSGGSLRKRLKDQKKGKVTTGKKISFCIDAAKGMEYLENQKCIHRDLAARNCLLTDNESLKISDFGLSIQDVVHKVSGKKRVPVKWTAPEAVQFGIFTSKSDVWSFGILMYEIFADGGMPYQGKSNKEVIAFIKAGNRAEPPTGTPKVVAALMHDCWLSAHPSRPTFTQLKEALQGAK